MLSHGNLLFNFEAANQVVDFYETDVFLAFLPLSHIYGRIVDEIVALGFGDETGEGQQLATLFLGEAREVRAIRFDRAQHSQRCMKVVF